MATNRQPSKDAASFSTSTAAISATSDDKWDEERYEASLRRLHDLHIKLRKLRTTIPRMVEPVRETQTSNPEALFSTLQASIATGMKDVKNFKDSWTDDATTKVLERARLSRQKNPLAIKPWRPRDDPNWTKMDID